MKNTEKQFPERVVEMVETCDDQVIRTFYCIRDPECDHWMSVEPFDGMIWTKDPKRRREFVSRWDAESELDKFLDWRGVWDDVLSDASLEQEAA